MKRQTFPYAAVMIILASFATDKAAAAQQPSAFNDKTYFTTSPDGLTWSEGVLLAERASVPEVNGVQD